MDSSSVESEDELSYSDDGSSLSMYLSEEEEDGDYTDKLSSLRDLVSSVQPATLKRSATQGLSSGAQELSAPSDFGFNPKQKLTVADLIPTISDSDPRLRKSLKLLDSHESKTRSKRPGLPEKLHVPLPKLQQNRLDRAAAYEKSKETLDRWIDSVKHNRRAEHLTFPLADPTAGVAQGLDRLIPTFHTHPLNDLEGTIQEILQHSGLTSSNGQFQEDQILAAEELHTNKLSLDEVQTRRAELRKARELLFREEVRAKRIKKIKSKSYRRVHRKQRHRDEAANRAALDAAGVLPLDDEQERNERRRAEERIGARHRENKWAKGIRQAGRTMWDQDARAGITEMAKRSEELQRRIHGKRVAVEDENASDSASESSTHSDNDDEDYDNDGNAKTDTEVEARRARLRGKTAIVSNVIPNGGMIISGSNLLSMNFMQKAAAARKQHNDDEEQHLLAELDGLDDEKDTEEVLGTLGRRKFGPSNNSRHILEVRSSARNEQEEGAITDEESERGMGKPTEDDFEAVTDMVPRSKVSQSYPRKRQFAESEIADDQTVAKAYNPWLAAPAEKQRSHKSRKTESDSPLFDQGPAKRHGGNYNVSTDHLKTIAKKPQGLETKAKTKFDVTESKVVSNWVSEEDDESDTSLGKAGRSATAISNQELIKKAFAGDEVVADFEKEKQYTVRDEDEKVIDQTLPGWGSWTGVGISRKQQKQNRRFLTKEEGIKKQDRRDIKLDRVIINEKRVKKNVKYLAAQLPHPFETRQQYERSLRLPVGPEWTTKETFQAATKPRIMFKQGIITPMESPIV